MEIHASRGLRLEVLGVADIARSCVKTGAEQNELRVERTQGRQQTLHDRVSERFSASGRACSRAARVVRLFLPQWRDRHVDNIVCGVVREARTGKELVCGFLLVASQQQSEM
jgi:hypothetical protein